MCDTGNHAGPYEYMSLTSANNRIVELERKLRNQQENFEANCAATRKREYHYEAEIRRLREENEQLRSARDVSKRPRVLRTEVHKRCDGEGFTFMNGFFEALKMINAVIIEDMENSNVEKWEHLLFMDAIIEDDDARWKAAKWLDSIGAQAPEVK